MNPEPVQVPTPWVAQLSVNLPGAMCLWLGVQHLLAYPDTVQPGTLKMAESIYPILTQLVQNLQQGVTENGV